MTWMNRRRRNRKCWSLEFIRTASKTRLDGSALECRVLGEEAVKLVGVMSVKVAIDTSMMPGVVKVVSVIAGDKVGEGQECAVVEAMKMQNSLSSGITIPNL